MGLFLLDCPFDGEQEEPVPAPPTLGDILDRELPPCPVPPENWEGVVPMLGNLPSALDLAYIRRLLEEEEGMARFREQTPTEVQMACEEQRVRIRQPERDPFCRRLTVLSGFCAWWLGDPAAAFYKLYNATDNSVCASKGGGPVDVEVLRARSMAVPLIIKRHIAQKDLGRLMELDPENRDVYLLCRAWLCSIQPYGQERLKAQADLEELVRLGGVRRDDPRVDLRSFQEDFLSGVLARRKRWAAGSGSFWAVGKSAKRSNHLSRRWLLLFQGRKMNLHSTSGYVILRRKTPP